MEVLLTTENNIYTLEIIGQVDAGSSIGVDEKIRESIDHKAEHILVNCIRLDYISSAGLGVFMSYLQEVNEKEINLCLYGMSESVYKVFEILGLHNLLKIVSTKEEALA